MPGSGAIAEPGFAAVTPGSGEIIAAPVSVCHQVSTMGVRLAPSASRYQRHASGLIGLTDGAQQPQAGQVVGVGDLAAPLHERADQRRRGVIDRDAVLFDHLEMPMLVRRGGCALVEHLGHPVGQRPVDDVGVPGDPTDVGGAPEHVGFRLDVEDVVVRVRRLGEVATGGVHDALRRTGGARGVEQKQWLLGVEGFGGVLG